MEDTRFDDWAKTFSALTTRRLTFGVLLAGALGHLGLGAVDARKGKHTNGGKGKGKTGNSRGKAKGQTSNSRAKAKAKTNNSRGSGGGQGVGTEVRSRACKPACGACQSCKPGKCPKARVGKKKCTAGKCQPKSGIPCTAAGGGSGTCQSGACIPAPPRECTSPADCPAPPAAQWCADATCRDGTCGVGPKVANTVCRPAAGDCDVAEVCDGAALECPPDAFKPKNTPCTDDLNVCTFDVCSGTSSTCTHLAVSNGIPCGATQICCSGDCKSKLTDAQNCGSCGKKCAAGQGCCGGTCLGLQDDENNCGSCGKKCPTGQICCGGTCRDLKIDEGNCGACGKNCPTGQTCCDGTCVNLRTDRENCGSCGRTCPFIGPPVNRQLICCSGTCLPSCS